MDTTPEGFGVAGDVLQKDDNSHTLRIEWWNNSGRVYIDGKRKRGAFCPTCGLFVTTGRKQTHCCETIMKEWVKE